MGTLPPLVFNIHRFALDDGPGIRTTLFFKGCPLHCGWCHNPEGVAPGPELVHLPSRCIRCGACLEACPGAPGACTACGRCVPACPAAARRICGVAYAVEELVALALRDRPYFEASGGGVTLTGGEPTWHLAFAGELARELTRRGIQVALQTCGHFHWDRFADLLLPFVDLVYCDLKLMDPARHLQATGVDNAGILGNLERLHRALGTRLTVRTPLVPGITDSPENLSAIARFLGGIGVSRHLLLPFNPVAWGPEPPGGLPCRSISITQ